jgi:hypothetical protein
MQRRRFLQAGMAMTLASRQLVAAPTTVAPMAISPGFKRRKAPETGRLAVQLTWSDFQCYPLDYYVPSITADNRYLVYHKSASGQLQLHRLDLTTLSFSSFRFQVAKRRHALAMGANPWWACEPEATRVAKRRHVLIDAEKHCRPHPEPNRRPTGVPRTRVRGYCMSSLGDWHAYRQEKTPCPDRDKDQEAAARRLQESVTVGDSGMVWVKRQVITRTFRIPFWCWS